MITIVRGPDDRATPPPIPAGKAFLKYSEAKAGGPGFVEIKPHTIPWIKAGLEQLARRRTDPKSSHLKDAKPYLLTYTYRATPTPKTSMVTGYLLKPNDKTLETAKEINADRKAKIEPRKPWPTVLEKGQAEWLEKLGEWWPLGSHTVPDLSFGEWSEVVGPGAIGSMLEHPLKMKFIQMHMPREHPTRKKGAGEHGADIEFKELAEFLYELEAALERAA